ncbi:hypothetical protein AM500_10815 [Bacillus sp. FJAT-18017]|uniref:hypothetical protein n=1 Tax=Bacillus sp. FJAT-18017 TaxID=1705566 RepID=UPI0006AE584A|nr:hypothetical protein [Bacillus sp. FJAT-18017]ALC90218.1 hypothetical protein AM500_10815 [Bacillus sp. FJAT-18017]
MLKRIGLLVIIISLSFSPEIEAVKRGAAMTPWDEARQVFPRYSKFTVVDVETGLSFNVQRRAGSRHADVQPLTAKDTKIMKKIYGGKWSWKRRAIYAVKGNKKIAASMNGMPHGAGALQNKFPGHFCIHFNKSSTHRRREMDLSHKLMVYKAGGKLNMLLANASPVETVSYYVAGYKEQDKRILSLLSLKKTNWQPILKNVENAKIARLPLLPAEDLQDELTVNVPVEIEWQIEGEGRVVEETEIHLFRPSPASAWKVDSHAFLEDNPFLVDRDNVDE